MHVSTDLFTFLLTSLCRQPEISGKKPPKKQAGTVSLAFHEWANLDLDTLPRGPVPNLAREATF